VQHHSVATLRRLLDTTPATESGRVEALLERCSTIEIGAGEAFFRSSFDSAPLLVVERGFVVLRASFEQSRSIVTCEAGPGRILLPPGEEEMLIGLAASRLTALSAVATGELMALPGAAQALLDLLTASLGEKQENLSNFASARHVVRVRRKLLQLARNYGRVVRDGVRIDFPISHSLLAEMVGSSRETVTRALDELQRTGFVARSGRTYRLLVSPESIVAATRADIAAM
jgi:CRP/FNR family transcriptional regulator, nitrogen oxide reductase regulator